MKERDKLILQKIKSYAVQITEFKGGTDFENFSRDAKTISACVFNLSQIGELAKKLDADFVKSDTDIPWQKIKGLRNRIVHDYEGVKLGIVWNVLHDFLPDLIKNINKLLGN
jgi:uncharacterized protein with HEPN domain